MKIAFFTAPHLLQSDTSDTRYVYESLRPIFETNVFDRPEAELCHDSQVVFTRFPLPLERPFLEDLTQYRDKLIVNDPRTQLSHSKRHLLAFDPVVAPTIITSSHHAIREFAQEHKTVVFKPLDKHKGVGIKRFEWQQLTTDDGALIIERYVAEYGTPVVQRYIADVTRVGDKRINIIAYEPVSAVVTHPAPGSFICHEAAGGSAYPATITTRDSEIIDLVTPFLRDRGIFWAALDIIGPYLGEINLLTPAMVLRADRAHRNRRGADAIVAALQRYERMHLS